MPDIETCAFFEAHDKAGADATLPPGVYTLQDLRQFGRKKGWCPYFLARNMLALSNVIVYNYQYMLDPKVSQMVPSLPLFPVPLCRLRLLRPSRGCHSSEGTRGMQVSKELEKECVVVFDEAHNIDNVCIEALSVNLREATLASAASNLTTLQGAVQRCKASDAQRLQDEYHKLVRGLRGAGILQAWREDTLANPALPDDILAEAVPGNIRRCAAGFPHACQRSSTGYYC